MIHTVEDVIELVRYHIVLGDDDRAEVDLKLRQLGRAVEHLRSEEAGRLACDEGAPAGNRDGNPEPPEAAEGRQHHRPAAPGRTRAPTSRVAS